MCAFVNIPGAHPLWTSFRHERSMSITILRDSRFGAFLTWRMTRQQTPINKKKCLPVIAAPWYILKWPEVMVSERRKPILLASWAQGQCVRSICSHPILDHRDGTHKDACQCLTTHLSGRRSLSRNSCLTYDVGVQQAQGDATSGTKELWERDGK